MANENETPIMMLVSRMDLSQVVDRRVYSAVFLRHSRKVKRFEAPEFPNGPGPRGEIPPPTDADGPRSRDASPRRAKVLRHNTLVAEALPRDG